MHTLDRLKYGKGRRHSGTGNIEKGHGHGLSWALGLWEVALFLLATSSYWLHKRLYTLTSPLLKLFYHAHKIEKASPEKGILGIKLAHLDSGRGCLLRLLWHGGWDQGGLSLLGKAHSSRLSSSSSSSTNLPYFVTLWLLTFGSHVLRGSATTYFSLHGSPQIINTSALDSKN